MHKRWPVALPKNVRPDLENVIGTKTNEVSVESRVMQLAQRKSVSDNRFSFRFGIPDDVSGVKELFVSQSAE